jgi:hypothetical protein
MSFMQKQIYKGSYFEIDTTHGTEIVPSDVIGRTVGTHIDAFADYLEGSPYDTEECVECKDGWIARMSAPGYTDCTSWSAHKTEKSASDYLDEMYGEGEEDTEAVERGEEIVNRYCNATGTDRNDAVCDILDDLMKWTKANNIDFAQQLSIAKSVNE